MNTLIQAAHTGQLFQTATMPKAAKQAARAEIRFGADPHFSGKPEKPRTTLSTIRYVAAGLFAVSSLLQLTTGLLAKKPLNLISGGLFGVSSVMMGTSARFRCRDEEAKASQESEQSADEPISLDEVVKQMEAKAKASREGEQPEELISLEEAIRRLEAKQNELLSRETSSEKPNEQKKQPGSKSNR